MPKLYYNVAPRTVLNTFENAAPCNCHSNNYEYSAYNVRTKTASSYVVGRGPLIKSICVQCTLCKREVESNVESYGVYENDFKPY